MNTLHVHLIELQKADSTNEFAADLLKTRDIPEGTVIWALEQFAGKGQGNNTWESEPGKNLTFTLVLHPAFLLPARQFLLNEAITLGIIDFTRSLLTAEKIQIKWPNDIYAGNRKLGGILINNIISGTNFETSMVGIGLNVNQVDFPSTLPNPVSLAMLANQEFELKQVLSGLCHSILIRYHQLQKEEVKNIYDDSCRSLMGFESWEDYRIGEEKMTGKITGVTDSGKLMVQTRQGKGMEFDHHEIEFISLTPCSPSPERRRGTGGEVVENRC